MVRPALPLVPTADGRFLAADNSRFLCMFAVVALHCTRTFSLANQQDSVSVHLFATPFKFATIGFFVISGFLLQHDLARYASLTLLHRRLRKILFPWLFWSSLFVLALTTSDFLQHRAPFTVVPSFSNAVLQEISRTLTTTALWFVPNLLLSLALLLLLRSHLYRCSLGAALLAINLFYTANIYAQCLPPHHTRALFAFTFYLWLGHFAALHRQAVAHFLQRVPLWAFLLAATLTAALAFGESRLLFQLHSLDPGNTLRLTNQLFSLCAILFIAKLRRPVWPRFVDVPRHTFGIYLSHALIVGLVLTGTRRLLQLRALHPYSRSAFFTAGLWLTATAIAWTAGLVLSRTIAASPRLCVLQGLERPPEPHNPHIASIVDPRRVPEGVALFIG